MLANWSIQNTTGTPAREGTPPRTIPGPVVWLAAAGALLTLLAVLTLAVRAAPASGFERAILDWVAHWWAPGLRGAFTVISFLSGGWRAFAVSGALIAVLRFTGRTRQAAAIAIAGATVGLGALVAEYGLAHVTGQTRPAGISELSFPSGHVYFSTVTLGFIAYLAATGWAGKRRLVPMLAVLGALLLAVGASRLYQEAHWPSDVAGGYLLGAIGLLAVIAIYRRLEHVRWLAPPKVGEDIPAVTGDGVRITGSYASAVALDPAAGTATKFFNPPAIIRALYWIAFQARFPYERNLAALEASRYRRQIAGLLTQYRFGKNLVAPVQSVRWSGGRANLVTELVPGEEAKPEDSEARRFLGDVSELFAEAGLPVWQLNPHNPHSHTNLILTPDGDYKIIDLESAVVTPIPARGQFRSALRRGAFPIFDDVDFDRLSTFVAANRADLEASLGVRGMRELHSAINDCERAVREWHGSELRLAGKTIKVIYALFNWKAAARWSRKVMASSDGLAEAFLGQGLDRWHREGRITTATAAVEKAYLADGEVREALRHLGAHLVISAIFRFPFGSIIRSGWTLAFFVRELALKVLPGRRSRRGSLALHNPIVVVLGAIPGFGAFAYLAARPLRRWLLIRLMADQVAWKLPFSLYRRLRVGRWLPPRPDIHRRISAARAAGRDHGLRPATASLHLTDLRNATLPVSTGTADAGTADRGQQPDRCAGTSGGLSYLPTLQFT